MKLDPQVIIDACNSSHTMCEAGSKVDINFQTFRKYAKALNLWRPNQSGKGTLKPKPEGADKYALQEILDGKYPHYSSHKLRLRLIVAGIKKDKCEICGVEEWNGKKLSKHLDHIDGNPRNHSLENLRILCPNCHQQTETHGSKKLKRK